MDAPPIHRWVDDAGQDLRVARRLLQKKPGPAPLAVLTPALGVGAATAVFGIVVAVLVPPLPYRNPDRLVAILARRLREKGLEKVFAPYDDHAESSRLARSFEQTSAAQNRYLLSSSPARAKFRSSPG